MEIQKIRVKLWQTSKEEDDVKSSRFNLYPNPTNGFITIELEKASKYELSIVNVLGQTVYTNSIFKINNRVDLSSFEIGVYTIELSDGNNIYSEKLIVE